MKGDRQTPDYHPEGRRLSTHTLLLLEQLERPSETLALRLSTARRRQADVCAPGGAADHVLRPHRAGRRNGRGHSQTAEAQPSGWERVAYLVRNHLRQVQAPQMRLSTLKRFSREDGIDELLELARIDAVSSNGDLQYYRFCKERVSELKDEEIRPQPLLRGGDLIALDYTGTELRRHSSSGGRRTAWRRPHQPRRSARVVGAKFRNRGWGMKKAPTYQVVGQCRAALRRRRKSYWQGVVYGRCRCCRYGPRQDSA